jgi:hypothetical protein
MCRVNSTSCAGYGHQWACKSPWNHGYPSIWLCNPILTMDTMALKNDSSTRVSLPVPNRDDPPTGSGGRLLGGSSHLVSG